MRTPENTGPAAPSPLPEVDLCDVREVEQVAEALRDLDLCATQLGSGPQQSVHDQVVYEDLIVLRFIESRAIAYQIQLPHDTTAISLFKPSSPLQRWCGVEVPHGVSLVQPGGREYVIHYPAGFDSVSIVASDSLLDALEVLPSGQPWSAGISTRWMSPLSGPGRSFRDWLLRTFASRGHLRRIGRDPLYSQYFRERALAGIVEMLADRAQAPRVVTSTFRRYELARRALELIEDDLSARLSAEDIAHRLEVSPRVLQLAFRQVLGATPYEFVVKRKLAAARSELLRHSTGGTSVTATATKYGFTELGRFAKQYRSMFGELPSATLAHPVMVSLR